MSNVRVGMILGLAVSVAGLGLLGCGDSSGSGGTGAAGGGSSNGGEATGGSATGGNGTGGSAPSGGYCAIACTTVADCCQGNPSCPGDAYPNNPTCDGGFCTGAQCAVDDDCTFGGTVPGYECHPIDVGGSDYKACLAVCTTTADCTASLTCTGNATDGTKYCTADAVPCTGDGDCQGYGVCDTETGGCTCSADADCTAAGTKCNQ